MRPERGFTLMEVLVALVLLSLFALVSYRALDSVLVAQRRAGAEMDRWRQLAVAFSRLEADLANAVGRFDIRHSATDGLHASLGADGMAQFDLLRLLPEDADQGLLRIGYRCAGDRLLRLDWPAPSNRAGAPREFVLLSGLGACAFQFMDRRGVWLNTWQSNAAQPLPAALALDIKTADGTPIRRVWRLQ